MAAENIGGRPITFCPLCKQVDDHVKHLYVGEPDGIGRHTDCCRAAGCPDGTCDVLREGAEELTGANFLGHVLDLHEQEDVEALKAEHQVENPTQDPGHESFVGFDTTFIVGGPTQLQGADR